MRPICLFIALLLASAAPLVHAQSSNGSAEPTLDEVRAASERFRDVNVALAEGYIADPGSMCATAEMMGQPAELGAMGLHYFRPDLLGITTAEPRVNGTSTHTDFLQPGILIYEPQEDGSLELVAVENLVFIKPWHEAGHTGPPVFHQTEYNMMADDANTEIDEAHMFEPHYDMHIWLYRENPKGVFSEFNPDVTCAHHRPAAPEHQH